MIITLEIPEEFEEDYEKDKFQEYFERVLADTKYSTGLCGGYEHEITDMLIKAFDESEVI